MPSIAIVDQINENATQAIEYVTIPVLIPESAIEQNAGTIIVPSVLEEESNPLNLTIALNSTAANSTSSDAQADDVAKPVEKRFFAGLAMSALSMVAKAIFK